METIVRGFLPLDERVHRRELARFVSRPVVDALLRGTLGDEPERRNVTLLVCDLAGVTSLAERVEPEELATILAGYLREVISLATEHGAVVEGIAGERIALMFGAPERCEPCAHALAAVGAATAIRSRVEAIGARARRSGLVVETRARIAITTGLCTVGIFGGDDLRTYSAVGFARAIATALATEAAAGAIVLAESTWVLVRDTVDAQPLAPLSSTVRSVKRYELGARARPAPESEPAAPESAPSPSRSIFKEGDFWTLRFDGAVLRLKDSKGISYLALLLAAQNAKFHALDLVAHGETDDISADAGDAGPTIDRRARDAYRRRLDVLRHELQEAKAHNDPARVAPLTEEMNVLSNALAQAYGLGGRDRRAASAIERARVNVTRNIKDALRRIEKAHPALGRHLGMSVRTGVLCVYAPPEEVSWEGAFGHHVMPCSS